MPTDTEIVDQLARYSSWLEAEVGAELGPAEVGHDADDQPVLLLDVDGDSSVAVSSDRVTMGGHHRWLAMAAAVVVMAGGLYALGRPDGSTTGADGAAPATDLVESDASNEDPDPEQLDDNDGVDESPAVVIGEPLYVLPASLAGYEVESFDDDPIVENGISLVVGEPTEWGFDRVVGINVSESVPFGGNFGDTVEMGGRTGERMDVGGFEVVAFELLDGRTLAFSGAVDDVTFDIITSATRVTETGIQFDPTDGIVALGEPNDSTDDPLTNISLFSTDEPTIESTIWISTVVEAGDELVLIPGFGSVLEHTEVRGRDALLARHPSYFDFVSLVWFETDGEAVQLLAPSEAEARELAEGLRVVDQATWEAELSALPVHDPVRPVIGYPHGALSFVLDSGESVRFEPDGAPVVVVAVRPNCSPCLDRVASLDAALDGINPDLLPQGTRFVAVALEDPGELDLDEIWSGPVLRMSPTASDEFTEALELFGVLLLDGTNTSITSLSLADGDVVDQLLTRLADATD